MLAIIWAKEESLREQRHPESGGRAMLWGEDGAGGKTPPRYEGVFAPQGPKAGAGARDEDLHSTVSRPRVQRGAVHLLLSFAQIVADISDPFEWL